MTIGQVLTETLANGGGTYDAATLEPIVNGPWAVGGRMTGQTIALRDDPDLLPWVTFGAIVGLRSRGAVTIGTWVDEDVLYVDAVDLIVDTNEAIRLAARRGELAIYHLTDRVTLEVSAVTCGECGNILTIVDTPGTLCQQCRRVRSGGRAPKVRVMSRYEREQRTIERRRGW